MKKYWIILMVLLSNSVLLFAQDTTKATGNNFLYPYFLGNFSAEESWQIHKEAYRKQLKAAGHSESQIEQKMTLYEDVKVQFIERINKQMAEAEIQREQAELMRKKAADQRKEADALRKQAEQMRMKAEVQRQQADVLRKQAEESSKVSAVDRQKAAEQRKQAEVQRQQAEKLREEADVQRKKAEALRIQVEEQIKKSEVWRNSFWIMLEKNIALSSSSATVDPITINIETKTSLLFSIHGKLNAGNVLVEIINPKGEKEGELSLEHKLKPGVSLQNNLLKFTSGSINKTIADVETGHWQIKISPKKSEGTVSITVARYNKPA